MTEPLAAGLERMVVAEYDAVEVLAPSRPPGGAATQRATVPKIEADYSLCPWGAGRVRELFAQAGEPARV